MKIEDAKIQNALDLLLVDFEQRSQQVVQLSLDRSKFIRIALLIWGVPLAVGGTLFFKPLVSNIFPPILSPIAIIALSFLLSSLANCIVLSAIIGNRNSANLAASGMNYIRSLCFHSLSSSEVITLNENIRNVIGLAPNKAPEFILTRSASTDLMIIFFALLNIIYASVGCLLSFSITHSFLILSISLLILSAISHSILLKKIPLISSIKQK